MAKSPRPSFLDTQGGSLLRPEVHVHTSGLWASNLHLQLACHLPGEVHSWLHGSMGVRRIYNIRRGLVFDGTFPAWWMLGCRGDVPAWRTCRAPDTATASFRRGLGGGQGSQDDHPCTCNQLVLKGHQDTERTTFPTEGPQTDKRSP